MWGNKTVGGRILVSGVSWTPVFRENQFGAAVGGPIVKDKTFFFVNYDGQRIRNSLTNTFSVPTSAERAGDLSGLVPVPTGTPNSKAKQLIDPFTQAPIPQNNLANDPSFVVSSPAQALVAKLQPTPSSSNPNNLLAIAHPTINP